jgi:hypothetical protein
MLDGAELIAVVNRTVTQAYDLELEELRQEAILYGWRIAPRFDGRGDIYQWLGYRIKCWLGSKRRYTSWRRQFQLAHNTVEALNCVPVKEAFDVGRLLIEVSDDAAMVVRIALSAGTKQELMRRLHKLRWLVRERIDEVFQEIREALQS